MTLTDYITGWNGQEIAAPNLLAHYVAECYGITVEVPETVADYWNYPTEAILKVFSRVGGNDAQVGDVILYGESGGIVNNVDGINAEVLESTGIARLTLVAKGQIYGVLRPYIPMLPTAIAAPLEIDEAPVITEAPVPVYKAPAGAERANSPPYQAIVKAIPGYLTPSSAIRGKSPMTTVSPGEQYYLFTSKQGMDNVTLSSSVPGVWINPADNVADPEPEVAVEVTITSIDKKTADLKRERERILQDRQKHFATTKSEPVDAPPVADEPVQQSPAPFTDSYVVFQDEDGERVPKTYVAMRDVTLVDGQGKRPNQTWKRTKRAPVAGVFSKDGVLYARPQYFAERFEWMGAPMTGEDGEPNIELLDDIYDTKTTIEERRVLKSLTTADRITLAREHALHVVNRFKKNIKQK